jgi:hypothetical protein
MFFGGQMRLSKTVQKAISATTARQLGDLTENDPFILKLYNEWR